MTRRVRVGINGYGVIGKRVADAAALQDITIPENIDCIRALTGLERNADRSIAKTDAALGVIKAFLPSTTTPIPHLAGPNGRHPAIGRVVAHRAELRGTDSKVPTSRRNDAPRRRGIRA